MRHLSRDISGTARWRLFACAAVACSIDWADLVQANPQGPVVVNGQATVSRPDPRTLTVTNSPGAILNWNGFSIQPGETTRFNQANAASAVLNRVVGPDPSRLLGTLQSNGRVFLINPNGIVFGAGSVIDTAGLIASTLNMSNADFIAGRMRFTAGDTEGDIVNQGVLRAGENGQIVLIAPDIRNDGVIEARNGSILLAAGRSVELTGPGLEGVHFQVQAPENQVMNLGRIDARSGAVKVFAGTLKNSGTVRANSLTRNEKGEIVLVAKRDIDLAAGSRLDANGEIGGRIRVESQSGITTVSGVIKARGDAGSGGSVTLLGQSVRLLGSANVDASGETGGGTVLVGGDYQGKNPDIPNAVRTYVGPHATVEADAGTSGNGGKVIVWSDDVTQFYGAISARGGSKGGDGGFVETSGKRLLDFQGTVDTMSATGKTGTLLLDPADITISTSSPETITFEGDCGKETYCAANSAVSNILPNTLVTQTKVSNVLITTTSSAPGGGGDISVEAPVHYSTGNSLTLRADHDVIVDAAITNDQGGALTLTAGATGKVDIRSDLRTVGGAITINGGAGGMSLAADRAINAGNAPIAINGGGGPVDLSTGTLESFNAGASAVMVTNATTLKLGTVGFAGGGTLTVDHSLAGSQNPGTSIVGTGRLVKLGAGRMELSSGNNGYSGGTTISAGQVQVDNAFALGSGPVTVDAGGALVLANTTLGNALTLNGSGTPDFPVALSASGNSGLTGQVTLATNSTIEVLGNLAISGAVTGGGGLTLAGAGGILVLSGANTYAGPTAVAAATLVLSGGTAIPDTSAVTLASLGRLELQSNETIGSLAGNVGTRVALNANTLTTGNSTNTTFAGGIEGTGRLVKLGSGTLTLSGNSIYTGGTTISAGSVFVNRTNTGLGTGAVMVADGASLSLTNVTLSNALTLNGSGHAGFPLALVVQDSTLSGQVTLGTLATDSTIAVTGSCAISGPITGTGSLITAGSGGVLTLSGANTYAGITGINGATLIVSGGAAIPDSGAVTLSPSGRLELRSNETIGSLTGATGSRIMLNANTLTAGASGDTTFAGAISGTGGLTKQGSGRLTLSGTNTYTGATTITEGALVLAGGSAIADDAAVLVENTATLQLQTDETIGSLSGVASSNLFLVGSTLTTGDSTNTTFAGVIGNSGALTKQGSGTMTLAQPEERSFGPATLTVKQGTLRLAASNLLADTADVVVNAGATLDLGTFSDTVRTATPQAGGTILGDLNTTGAWVNSGTLLISHNRSFGQFSNNGSVELQSGTLSIGNDYIQNGGTTRIDTGATLVLPAGRALTLNGGTLSGGGTIMGSVANNGGTVAPGSSPGTLNITGNYVQSPSGVLNVELAGVDQGVTYDLINISGAASLAGTLNVLLAGGFVPARGSTFDILTYSSVTGNFATITGLPGVFFLGTVNPTFYRLEMSASDTTQVVIPLSCR